MERYASSPPIQVINDRTGRGGVVSLALAADTAYGSGANLNWLVQEKRSSPSAARVTSAFETKHTDASVPAKCFVSKWELETDAIWPAAPRSAWPVRPASLTVVLQAHRSSPPPGVPPGQGATRYPASSAATISAAAPAWRRSASANQRTRSMRRQMHRQPASSPSVSSARQRAFSPTAPLPPRLSFPWTVCRRHGVPANLCSVPAAYPYCQE